MCVVSINTNHGIIILTLQGCVDAITDRISDQIGVIAGVSIAIAVLLVRCI